MNRSADNERIPIRKQVHTNRSVVENTCGTEGLDRAALSGQCADIDQSPRQTCQRQQIERGFGDPLQKKPNQTGLPDELKSELEASLNSDFSDVRVHTGSSRARDVGAKAYTQGSDIHVAPGQFQPSTAQGKELLGHELAHVVQQREGRVSPTGEVGGMPLNDDPALEKEADEAATSLG